MPAKIFRRNILAKHPIILALFSGAGGRMILYRPGQPPVDAPSVPHGLPGHEVAGHSTMAISEVVMPVPQQRRRQELDGADARLPHRR